MSACSQLFLKIHNLLNLSEEPTVDPGQRKNLLDTEARAQRMAEKKDPLRIGHTQLPHDELARQDVSIPIDLIANTPRFAVPAQAGAANFQRAQRFLK